MPFSPIIEKIRSLAAGFTTFLGGFIGKIESFFLELRERIPGVAERLLQKIPQEYRRAAAVAAVVITVMLLMAGMGTLLLSRGGSGVREDFVAPDAPPVRFVIPPEELFSPDEPDFVPGVTAERERRNAWTEEDAAPWWRDPLKNGEQNWRDQIEKNVDEILEGVP